MIKVISEHINEHKPYPTALGGERFMLLIDITGSIPMIAELDALDEAQAATKRVIDSGSFGQGDTMYLIDRELGEVSKFFVIPFTPNQAE